MIGARARVLEGSSRGVRLHFRPAVECDFRSGLWAVYQVLGPQATVPERGDKLVDEFSSSIDPALIYLKSTILHLPGILARVDAFSGPTLSYFRISTSGDSDTVRRLLEGHIEFLLTEACRATKGSEEFMSTFWSSLQEANISYWRPRHLDLLQRTHSDISAPAPASLTTLLADLASWRLELARMVDMAEPGASPVVDRLLDRFVVETTDMLQVVQSRVMVSTWLSIDKDRESREGDLTAIAAIAEQIESNEKARDLRLSRWGLALVLPGLWMTFWSIPSAPSEPASTINWIVGLGAIILALVGYLGAKLIGRRKDPE